uniref:Protein MMS22-like N-terminal domain-containing protein n=1 Tax=Plectus sambesii TaxID=2011161 RepID=A0A914WM94_9BILA
MDSAYGHVGLVKQSTYLLADSLLAIAGLSVSKNLRSTLPIENLIPFQPCLSLDDVLPCECVAGAWSLLLTATHGAADATLWATLQAIFAFKNSTSDGPSTAYDSTLFYGFADGGSPTNTRPLLFLDAIGHLCRLFAARQALQMERGTSSLIALIGSVSRVAVRAGDRSALQRMMRTSIDLFSRIEPAAGADVVVQVAWEEMCKQIGTGSASFDADDKVLPQSGSSAQWIERILRYADWRAPTQQQHTTANIWQSFIEMTVVVCRSDAVWQRVRPRIYSKLPVGKLRAVSVVGLRNIVALWLTLAYAIDLREVTSKLVSQVLPAVLSPGGDIDRLQLYFRTVGVLLRWHHEKSLDCTQLSTLLFNCYNDSLKFVNETSVGRSVAGLLGEVITDTVQALVDNGRRFPTSAGRLLEVPLQPVIKCVAETTTERILETLAAVVDNMQPDDAALLTTIEERVWPVAYERWKRRRTASTATARLLGAVTRGLLLSRRRSAVEKLNAAACESLNDREDRRPPTTSTFIWLETFFADHRVFIEMNAMKKAPRDVALVVACWLSIAFLDDCPTARPNLHSVSRAVAQALLQSALPAFHASSDHTTLDVCRCLFSALTELGRRNEAQAQELAQEWICPIVPVIESELKAASDATPARFRQTYRLLGDLLQTCAPVLYRTGIHVNKCPLVRIYNGLIEKQVLKTTANDDVDSGRRPVYLALGGLAAGVHQLPFAQAGFVQRLVCQVVYHTACVRTLATAYETAMVKCEELAQMVLSRGVEYALMQTDGEKGRSFVTLCCRTLSRTANESVRRRLAMAMKTALGDGTRTTTWLRRPPAASADLVQAIAALKTPTTSELAGVLGAL